MMTTTSSRSRARLASVALGAAVALGLGTAYFASASPAPRTDFSVVVRRASDGKELKVGDEVAQLAVVTSADGSVYCNADRKGTELSVDAPLGDKTEVTESIDDDCRVTITRIGPPENTEIPGGVEEPSTPSQGG